MDCDSVSVPHVQRQDYRIWSIGLEEVFFGTVMLCKSNIFVNALFLALETEFKSIVWWHQDC